MAKTGLKSYKKNNYWQRRKAMFYKAIRNYHYVKLQITDLVEYAGSKIYFVSNNGNEAKIADILSSCPDYKEYRALYVSMQVRAIAVQVIPCCNMKEFMGGSAFIALLTDNEPVSVATCQDSDHSLVMNPVQFTSMYWKTGYPWSSSDDSTESYGKIGLAIGSEAQQGGMRWTVRFVFYVLYKTNS